MNDNVIYRSNIRIERVKGPFRRAYLPVEEDPVNFSTHSEIAEYYKHDPDLVPTHAATLDYVVAATAG